jgi:hypothetical protein
MQDNSAVYEILCSKCNTAPRLSGFCRVFVQMETDLDTYVFGIDVASKDMKADELSRAFEFQGNPEQAFKEQRVPPHLHSSLRRRFPDLRGMMQRVRDQGGRFLGPQAPVVNTARDNLFRFASRPRASIPRFQIASHRLGTA